MMQQSMASLGAPAWISDALLELFAVRKAGLAAGVSSTVVEIAGRQPTTFDQFLRDNAAAFH